MNLSDLIKTNNYEKINGLNFRISEIGSPLSPEEARALDYIEVLTLKTHSEIVEELILVLKELIKHK